MPSRKRIAILVLSVMMGAILLPGHIRHQKRGKVLATDPNTLVIGKDARDANSFDPAQANSATSCMVAMAVYDQLVGFSGTEYTRTRPELAHTWGNTPDGKTWIFQLREDVRFHSGNPMTADDVVWSLKRLLILNSPLAYELSQLGLTEERIQKLDNHTVSLTFNAPYAGFLVTSLLSLTGGSIIDSKVAQEHEQYTLEFPNGDWGKGWLADHSAGTGPFKLEQWMKGEEISLLRYDNWWGPPNWREPPPAMQKIVIYYITEPTAQRAALEKGDIDIAMDLLPNQINELQNTPNIRIQATSTFEVTYLGMNMYNFEPFRDERVRDAIRWAINYDNIFSGGGVNVGQTFIPRGMLAHNPVKPFHYDPETAKSLLIDAGYPTGFDVDLLCLDSFPWTEIADTLREDLDEVGIRVTIIPMEAAQMDQVYRQQNHELVLSTWVANYPDPHALAKPFAHCTTNGPEADIKLLAWQNMAENPELAAMVDAAAIEQDLATRTAMYLDLQERVLDWGPFAILCYPLEQHGVRTSVQGYEVRPLFNMGELWPISKEGATPPSTSITPKSIGRGGIIAIGIVFIFVSLFLYIALNYPEQFEMNQKLVVSAATILVLHNSLFLAISIITAIKYEFSLTLTIYPILWIGTHGLDIVGVLLLGIGLYGFSKAVPNRDLFERNTGLLFLVWVFFTLIWRLLWRSIFFSTSKFWRWLDDPSNFLVAGVFFSASLILTVGIGDLNKMIDRFRKRGIITKGWGILYTAYAALHCLGSLLITFGLLSGFLVEVFLGGLGLLIKVSIVPILGILLFFQLYRVFSEMKLSSES